ncbi:MAG: hypothetical protein K5985_02945 [Lachnospiraceae bacterium]|nr:hypothetical protein [Lachnospiraceae bacterium]
MCFDRKSKTSEVIQSHTIDTGAVGVEAQTEQSIAAPLQTVQNETVTKTKKADVSAATTDASVSVHSKAVERTAALRKTEETVERDMPPVYVLGQSIIDINSYRDDIIVASDEMEDVKNKIMMLQSFLSNPMPPFAIVPEDEAKYKDELESVKLAMAMMYNKLLTSMDSWLRMSYRLPKSTITTVRITMVRNLKSEITEEASLFAENMTEYRRSMIGSPEAIKGESKTWAEMLTYQRSVKIDLDELGQQPELLGGATSEVMKIHYNDKDLYFKQEDETYVGTLLDMIRDIAREFPGLDEADVEGFRSAMDRELHAPVEELGLIDEGSRYEAFYNLYYKKDFYYNIDTKNGTPLEKFVASIPAARQKTFEAYFKQVYKTFNQQGIAEQSAGIAQGKNLSRRNVATSRMASLMGIGDMFAESRTAVIKVNGKTLRGNLMEDAGGKDITYVERHLQARYSATAEDQLLILPVFDLLCGQIDRHLGNYMYLTGETENDTTEITGIKCIDNDMSFGCISLDKAKKPGNQLKELTRGSLHALPPKFKKALMSMDGAFLRLMLMDLLDEDELDSLVNRLEKIQEALTEAEQFYKQNEAKLSRKRRREKEDPELIKLEYLASFRNGTAEKSLEFSTSFSSYILPGLKTINSRIKARKKEVPKELKKKAAERKMQEQEENKQLKEEKGKK